MRTRLNGLTMRLERPRARVAKRFIEMLLPTEASATTRASTSRLWLFSALAIAEASVGKSISMKRFATRARGRSSRIVKPFSQIRVVVREQEEA